MTTESVYKKEGQGISHETPMLRELEEEEEPDNERDTRQLEVEKELVSLEAIGEVLQWRYKAWEVMKDIGFGDQV